MATYHVSFLSRNEYGQFKRRSFRVGSMESYEHVESYVRHGYRNGKWALEGPITVDGPIGSQSRQTVTIPV